MTPKRDFVEALFSRGVILANLDKVEIALADFDPRWRLRQMAPRRSSSISTATGTRTCFWQDGKPPQAFAVEPGQAS